MTLNSAMVGVGIYQPVEKLVGQVFYLPVTHQNQGLAGKKPASRPFFNTLLCHPYSSPIDLPVASGNGRPPASV